MAPRHVSVAAFSAALVKKPSIQNAKLACFCTGPMVTAGIQMRVAAAQAIETKNSGHHRKSPASGNHNPAAYLPLSIFFKSTRPPHHRLARSRSWWPKKILPSQAEFIHAPLHFKLSVQSKDLATAFFQPPVKTGRGQAAPSLVSIHGRTSISCRNSSIPE